MKLRHLVGAVLASGGIAVVIAFLGVELPFAIAWGLIGGALALVGTLAGSVDGPRWPPAPVPRETVRGSEVAMLAWGIDVRNGRVGHAVIRRLRALASRHLGEHGVAADDRAATSALLGDRAAALWDRSPTISDVEAALDALDTLSAPDHQRQEIR